MNPPPQPTFTLTMRPDGGIHITSHIAGFTMVPGQKFECYKHMDSVRLQLRIEELENGLVQAAQTIESQLKRLKEAGL